MTNIQRISVIGFGTMGSGIAQVFAMNRYEVNVFDTSEESINRGIGNIKWSLEKFKEKGQLKEDPSNVLSRIRTVKNLVDACKDADLIIEAVFENADIKIKLFKEIEKYVSDNTIIVSNTSSIPITYLQDSLNKKSRFAGFHWFNPPPLMKLIEIIKGKFTAEETIKTLYDLSIKIGKEPIVVNKDIRGFLTTRLIRTLRYQAIILYMRNFYSIPEIDSALIHKLGLPMGIFYLTDFTGGIQIEYDENKTYEKMKKFSPDFEPNIGFEKAYMESLKLIEKMIQEGKLGIKTGKGFYTYSSGKKLEIPKELGEKVDLLDLISPLINHAYFLIRIGVTDENSIDKSLKLGFNWKQGLFEFYRKNYSKEEIIRSLEKLSQKIPDLKEFYTPDELLVKGR